MSFRFNKHPNGLYDVLSFPSLQIEELASGLKGLLEKINYPGWLCLYHQEQLIKFDGQLTLLWEQGDAALTMLTPCSSERHP